MRPVLTVGRYSLYGELASGGMATIYFGRMRGIGGFNRTVAIKRMRREIAMDPEFVAMFLDEARLTSRIIHPNVVQTLDVVAAQGEVFLVMEYVRGESLERLRRASRLRHEPIPVPIAVSILCGTLAGLHAAHEATGEDGSPMGIVHRDVSPQNILVGEDGIARIGDFGIAKAESRLQVTQDGQMKGKLPYMAPEQLAGGVRFIDRRVDIFSSATVLWELLAGKRLFNGDHPGETIASVIAAQVPPLASLRTDVPLALDRAIRQALSRSPEERPPTAEAFAVVLEAAVGTMIASPRTIGAWLEAMANDVLESRTRYVREIESVPTILGDVAGGEAAEDPPSLPLREAPTTLQQDDASIPSAKLLPGSSAATDAELRLPRTRRFGLFAAGLVLGATALGIVLAVGTTGTAPPVDATLAAGSSSASVEDSSHRGDADLSGEQLGGSAAPDSSASPSVSAATSSSTRRGDAGGSSTGKRQGARGSSTLPYLPDRP